MPNTVLRAAMQQWISSCCGPDETVRVVDQLLELGVRPPVLTLTTLEELEMVPDGTALVVGDLSRGGQLGRKSGNAIAFCGEDELYPFRLEGLAPPLPATVVWVPVEGRRHFARIFARQTADLLGLDRVALLRELGEEDL